MAHEQGIETWVSLEPVIYPQDAMYFVEICKEFVGHWKVGTFNYHPHGKTINWHDFGFQMKAHLDKLGAKYYFKEGLATRDGGQTGRLQTNVGVQMITEQDILNAHKHLPDFLSHAAMPNHVKHSAQILAAVAIEAREYPLPHQLDLAWPFHLIFHINGHVVSVFAGGWSRLIEVQELKGSFAHWEPDLSKPERGFLTAKGLVNFLLRVYRP